MGALQREIVDERRGQILNATQLTGANSLGPLGLSAGLTASGDPWGGAFAVLHSESRNVWDLSGQEFFIELKGVHVPTQAEVRPRVQGFRERELEWRRTHTASLKQLENQWVVLEGEEIAAHGYDAVQVIREAKTKGIRKPYIFFVEQKRDNVIKIGL
jgi:hypothetical protein